MTTRHRTRNGGPQPPALETFCRACGEPFTSTREMRRVGEDLYVHTHDCEGWRLEPTVGAPLIVFAACLGFFGGALLLSALGWLWPFAVGLAVLACLACAWEVAR